MPRVLGHKFFVKFPLRNVKYILDKWIAGENIHSPHTHSYAYTYTQITLPDIVTVSSGPRLLIIALFYTQCTDIEVIGYFSYLIEI